MGESLSESPTIDELVSLCSELLPGTTPTPDSNLFALGGDSLTVSTLSALVEARWGVMIEAGQIFVARDLASLHRVIHA